MSNIQELVTNLNTYINEITTRNINIQKNKLTAKSIYDFKETKSNYYITQYENTYAQLKKLLISLLTNKNLDSDQQLKINNHIRNLDISFQTNNIDELKKHLQEASKIFIPTQKTLAFNTTTIPFNIKSEIDADFQELTRCFDNNCLRSSIILCGRLLETALHSKYYEETGFDILEKNPGIGLGNLIAKLKEKQISLPPGINEQIHLINNIRTFSVHKKKEVFNPTKQQTNAIILFTIDVLEKLFSVRH